MDDLIRIATAELARFLTDKLPKLSQDWWQKNVLDRLSFQQQRMARKAGWTTLGQFDFAALLQVLDKNLSALSGTIGLSLLQARKLLEKLRSLRNRWAHRSAVMMPDIDALGDAETIGSLLVMLGAGNAALDAIEAAKAAAHAGSVKVRMTRFAWRNDFNMEFVLIKPGEFQMGSPGTEKGRDADEEMHPVVVSKPFYLGKTVVTQRQ